MHALVFNLPAPDKAAALFLTYGPFFICFVLLGIVFTFASQFYKRIDKIRNNEVNEALLKDFRLSYKFALVGTSLTVLIAVGWWIASNILDVVKLRTDSKQLQSQVSDLQATNKEIQSKLNQVLKDQQSRYFVYDGILSAGLADDETLDASMAGTADQSFHFITFRDRAQSIWKFQISTNKPIEDIGPVEIMKWYNDQAHNSLQHAFIRVTFQMTPASKIYKLIKTGDGEARIQPAMAVVQPN